jgi:hypothetical protein
LHQTTRRIVDECQQRPVVAAVSNQACFEPSICTSSPSPGAVAAGAARPANEGGQGRWLQDIDLRRRTNAGLNKGEARNALARAVFFHRLGELRDRFFESQLYRASGLNLLVAAIILWNTRYLETAVETLRAAGRPVPDDLLRHVAPLGWEHVSLTGDYTWNSPDQPHRGQLRPLRNTSSLLAA